jgi:tetratricopeptide (TPR) repeat protein
MIGCAYSYIVQNKKKYATTFTGVLVVYVMVFAVATRARCQIWKTSANLWTDVISKYPSVPVAHNNRGLVYKEENQLEKALACYNEAIRVDPTYQGSYENRGNIFFLQGKSEVAIADFNQALKMKPKSEVAYNSRGTST